ncbi:MAG: N-acetylmuramic acid 6-phosphate etherase [Anaerolineae bacterium]|nr:N-acetylmuramic acid 6-phosphate etherase [Anaerolineae bacterium]MDW8173514.1 N-acetylmuramic acid 6-phosphate etherase [Anaerolineae bacterium]
MNSTESQNPHSLHLDQMSILEAARAMNAVDQTVALAVQQAIPQIVQAVEAIVATFRRGGRLIYQGAGTSGRLGVLDAVECVPTFGVSYEMVQGLLAGGLSAMFSAVEGAEDDPELAVTDLKAIGFSADDVLVGIAASGKTPYVLGGIAYARQLGARTVGLACNQPSPLLEQCDIPVALLTGPEFITGSTRLKAGTAQKMTLNMLSTLSMAQIGKVYGNLMVDVSITNQKLRERGERIIMQLAQVSREEAARALDAAAQQVKVAIVMLRRGVDAAQARRLLEEAEGYLRRVIGDV